MIDPAADVAGLTDPISGDGGLGVIGIVGDTAVPKRLQGQVDLREAEAGDRQVEVGVEFFQLEKFSPSSRSSQCAFCASLLSAIRSALISRLRKMPDLHHRYLRHAELLCCKHPGMADHDLLGVVHHDRHDEAKFADQSAIWLICLCECCRGLRASRTSSAIDRYSIWISTRPALVVTGSFPEGTFGVDVELILVPGLCASRGNTRDSPLEPPCRFGSDRWSFLVHWGAKSLLA